MPKDKEEMGKLLQFPIERLRLSAKQHKIEISNPLVVNGRGEIQLAVYPTVVCCGITQYVTCFDRQCSRCGTFLFAAD